MNFPVSHRPRSSLRALGFTLIELLTVIAIVGILAAIIMPVVGKVRQSARASVDLANMRELGKGMLLYAGDNRGALNIVPTLAPRDPSWGSNYWTRAAPYLSSELTSANFGTNTVQALSLQFRNQTLPEEYLGSLNGIAQSLTFATNKRLQLTTGSFSRPEDSFRNLRSFPKPATAPYIATGKWGFVNGAPGPLPTPVPSEGVFWPYPGQKTILVYLDGHAEFRGREITTAEGWAGVGP